jgi:nitroimidazol reductase NimA-like FMN-containing flavoprotein (pyridoxamine 5'-phosphate oxidase superfamily)
MLIHELSAEECAGVLHAASVGYLACAKDGEPYVVPIHYAFDAERRCLYGLSMVGRKIEWLRANPRACLAVDDITDKNHWKTVIVAGAYEELRDAADREDAERRCHQLLGNREEWWFPAMAKSRTREPRGVVLFRIRIEQMTGRRSARSDIA